MIRKWIPLGIFFLLFPTAAVFAQTELCVPQFLDGIVGPFQYRTTLVIQNQEQNQATVQFQFYDNNGMPMQQFMMNRRNGPGGHGPVGSNGQFNPDPIQSRAAVGYRSAGEGGLQTGFVMIRAQDRIQAHAQIQLYDFLGTILSETNIVPGAQFRQGSFYADRSDGAGIGLALTNPAEFQTAVVTLEIMAEDDVTVLGTAQVTLGPHAQIAQYIFQLFPNILTDDIGYIRITSSNPICALALHLRGFSMNQIPVVIEDPD
jgi:hypothetical protein